MSKQHSSIYIVLISIHGLIRGHDLELGRDADTGGQTKYVVDLAKALAQNPNVEAVDLITQKVVDSHVSDDYAKPVEYLADNARIVRINTVPEGYLRKEDLWDYLDGFIDNALVWLKTLPRLPDILHSHYADGGYVGVRLANFTEIPLVHTGHSLGRDKCRRLLASGLTQEQIQQRYHMARRIEAEEEVLANARLVITSTHNEISDQYELYDYYQPESMRVIPPGVDLTLFFPPKQLNDIPFKKELSRFLRKAKKPIILALSRPDERKNIVTLIEAYGASPKLQKIANLVIIAGNREDIRELNSGAQSVLTEILLLIDYYDLYGRVAIPKHHRADEVPDIYRLVMASRGVFINPALTEPFGLTLLEAAATGVPIVATENGGPVDIINNCQNGWLVDPLDPVAITKALLKLLRDQELWMKCSKNGLQGVYQHYSWQAHTKQYLKQLQPLFEQHGHLPSPPKTKRPMRQHDRALFSDLDQNLLGNPKCLAEFAKVINQNRKCAGFGIATGRNLSSALAVLKKYRIPMPDVLITSLGTEIYYTPQFTQDIAWSQHIDHSWNPTAIRRILSDLPGLFPQEKSSQSRFKISYHYDPETAPSVEDINTLLRKEERTVNVIHAFGQFLDIVPARASKGLALRYFSQRWDIPLEHILVAGGSGADEDMMRGNTLAVVVANRHHEELSKLVDQERIYFAKKPYALGILEAIEHYQFYQNCMISEE